MRIGELVVNMVDWADVSTGTLGLVIGTGSVEAQNRVTVLFPGVVRSVYAWEVERLDSFVVLMETGGP